MSTRATISCKQDDDRYAAIYLHFDGYPEHAGKILEVHYKTIEDALTLVSGGDTRSIANDGTPERFSNGNWTVLMPTRIALFQFARNCDAAYLYVFEDDVWHCEEL